MPQRRQASHRFRATVDFADAEDWVGRAPVSEASGDEIGSPRPPRMSRYTRWPRPPRVVVLAAVLVLGVALSTTYLLTRSDTRHRGGVLTIVSGTELWFPQGRTVAFDPAV